MIVILVTGSREHIRYDTVERALRATAIRAGAEPEQVTVRHGGQGVVRGGRVTRGADLIADAIARRMGMAVDPHPADWRSCVPDCPPDHRQVNSRGDAYCPSAGLRRNAAMVASAPVPDYYLAFPFGRSPGTRHCVALARRAGITEGDYGGGFPRDDHERDGF